ncbi:CBS domain-containing protein [Actinomadura miaoliensis]|uniref:CBS domain-containing protein n=2 Tax=Actinomadura miaoliensis TaxID=430685 RepID=A0ABP7VYE8_9ACTN
MTRQVVTVAEETPFIEIVDAMTEHHIHAVPVVGQDGQVIGIVTDADLLRKQEYKDTAAPRTLLELLRHRRAQAKAGAVDARGLMSSPAVTVPADATIAEAARLLARHGFKQAPVVDTDGHPAGIVTRADLLRVFLRSDDDIRDEIIREVLVDRLWQDPSTVAVHVQDGVVQLTGRVERRSMIPVLIRLAAATEGVVNVHELLYYKHDDTIPESYRRV